MTEPSINEKLNASVSFALGGAITPEECSDVVRHLLTTLQAESESPAVWNETGRILAEG